MWHSSPSCPIFSLAGDEPFVQGFDLRAQGASLRLDHQADKLLAYLRKLLALYHRRKGPFARSSPQVLATSPRRHPGQTLLTSQACLHSELCYSAIDLRSSRSREVIHLRFFNGGSTPTL